MVPAVGSGGVALQGLVGDGATVMQAGEQPPLGGGAPASADGIRGSSMGLPGLGGPAGLAPCSQAVWRRLAAAAFWQRGGDGGRPGGGLDLHRPVCVVLVLVERRAVYPLRQQRGSAHLSTAVRPTETQLCSFLAESGAGGNACGRRHLLGGVVMALFVLPTSSAGGNPRSGWLDRTVVAPRCRPLLGGFV